MGEQRDSVRKARGRKLLGRTFYGQLALVELVVAVTLLVTMALVAVFVWPERFHRELVEQGPLESAADLFYFEAAFVSSMWLSLGLAILVSGAVAVTLGLVLVHPLRQQLRQLSALAADVAAGDYSRRLDSEGASDEVRLLVDSFNAMATKLGEAEASRQALLADLAHELRTPISSISVTVEALTDGVLAPDEDTMASLTEQAERLARLAVDLRDIADAEGGLSLRPRPCRAVDLLGAARAAAAEAYSRKGVAIALADTAAPVVMADPQRVGQVLANLLSNALRHTPSGGEVKLSARRTENWVGLRVADNGDGIEAEHLPRIFDRFYRTDAARARDAGGNGIGLAVSAEIARAHGGSLSAFSLGLGKGAQFELLLPLPGGS